MRPLNNFRRVLLTAGPGVGDGRGRARHSRSLSPPEGSVGAHRRRARHRRQVLRAGVVRRVRPHVGRPPPDRVPRRRPRWHRSGGVGETESGQTIYEEDETLPVELDTAKVLAGKGFTVVVSRTCNRAGGATPVRRRLRRHPDRPGRPRRRGHRDVCANAGRAACCRHLLRRRRLALERGAGPVTTPPVPWRRRTSISRTWSRTTCSRP